MNFCSSCGKTVVYKIPAGDNRKRYYCEHCGTIHYENPRIIAGCLPIWHDHVLLCKRAIAPRAGYWTLPAGFLENGETAQAGAIRETREEACAEVRVTELYTVFSLPHISQIYLFFRAELRDGKYAAGDETLEAALFDEVNIPWDDLAFPVIQQTLQHYFEDRSTNRFPVHTCDIIVHRDGPLR